MTETLTDPFELARPAYADGLARPRAKIRFRGDTELDTPPARPAAPRARLAALRAPSAQDVWLHLVVGLTAVLIVWTTLFTPFSARSAAADRFAVMLALSGGDLSDAGLKRYASHLDPAIVALARRITAERPRNPFASHLMQSQVAEPADRQGASFRYQDMTAQQARIWNALVPVSHAANPPAQPFVLKSDDIVNYQRAVNCLTAAVYYEAASESQTGQQAVAQVILNRMRHPTFPKTVCGVVFEGSQRTTGCQFSFACDGSLARRPSVEGWARARSVAVAALGGFVARGVGQATHYHAVYVAPYWSPTLLKVQNIGAHIFYRWMGGSGLPGAFSGAYAGTEPFIA
jgi:spore germination cell wall hydrolase CwlJ-like protein